MIAKEDFNFVSNLIEIITIFNVKEASLYENCVFHIEPYYSNFNETLLGFNLYYGYESLQYEKYIGVNFLKFMVDENKLYGYLKRHAEDFAKEYHRRMGY